MTYNLTEVWLWPFTNFEDILQDVKLLWGLVDPDGASSDLTAVQHQVIVLPTHLLDTSYMQSSDNLLFATGT